MSKKLWSMSTTVRNPYRIRDFLTVLSELDGQTWDKAAQVRFQILLIQNRFYIPEDNNLSEEQIALLDNPEITLTYQQAEDIFNAKQYEDPPMRGRNSYKPIEKAGLCFIIDKKVHITALGWRLINGEIEIEDFYFRSMIQWQYPNPRSKDFSAEDGYNTKPFISTLLLIQRVNQLCRKKGLKEKGISKDEFGIFALSLINYKDIDKTAKALLQYRIQKEKFKDYQERTSFQREFASEYLKDYVNYSESNLKDYTDNAIRYFRITRYIYVRGGGYYVDLEPRRQIELNKLFEQENGSVKAFESDKDFIGFMCDPSTYDLPWENTAELRLIAQQIVTEISSLEQSLQLSHTERSLGNTKQELEKQIVELRQIRSDLQFQLSKRELADISRIEEIIYKLENISHLQEKPSIALEKYAAIALNIINDAIRIQNNAPLGDDNDLLFTAAANVPDIEYEYQLFRGICEVTMLTGRNQWYAEGQPVMRHLRDYENRFSDKPSYCLFISPKLHQDTANTFWIASKYEYEGQRQRIIPLSISQLSEILKMIVFLKQKGKRFEHRTLLTLYDAIVNTQSASDSKHWIDSISTSIDSWIESVKSAA